MRVHGAYVSDDEVHRASCLFAQPGHSGNPMEEILSDASSGEISTYGEPTADEKGDAQHDAFYDEAVAMVIKARRVSVSSVQKQLQNWL